MRFFSISIMRKMSTLTDDRVCFLNAFSTNANTELWSVLIDVLRAFDYKYVTATLEDRAGGMFFN